jgi:hypothetical protein
MSSVEGMWLMRSSQIDNPNQLQAPSVIVLETGRVFGGDSAFYYVGNYSVTNGLISGRVLTRTHTVYENLENVFGMQGEINHEVEFEADWDGLTISGRMWPIGCPQAAQAFGMHRLSDLP